MNARAGFGRPQATMCSTAKAHFHGKRKNASAPAGSPGSVGAPPAGHTTGSGARASVRASVSSIPEPAAESVQLLRDLISSRSTPRPPGDFGHSARVFSDPELERLQKHYPELVKKWTQAGKRRRKDKARIKKEEAERLHEAHDRFNHLVAQPKSRPSSGSRPECFSIATPPCSPSADPQLQNDFVLSGPEVLRCIWCLSIDGTSLCTNCGRTLCTECMLHHACTESLGDNPAVMSTASEVLPFNSEFEELRCMRTCRRVGIAITKRKSFR